MEKRGQRGIYKTMDGGKNWKKVLGNNQWTGATDILIDPRNSGVLYAATWDRHRTVAALMGGGPGSGIHKSVDGGETWKKLYKGLPNDQDSNGDGKIDEDDLPTVNMGKIGLAISPQKPDVLYAAIELERTTQVGFINLKIVENLGIKCLMQFLVPQDLTIIRSFMLVLTNSIDYI